MAAMMRTLCLCAILSLVLPGFSWASVPQEDGKSPAPQKTAKAGALDSLTARGELHPDTFVFGTEARMNLGVSAARVARRSELPGGPWAQGNIRDYLLENDLIRVVVRNEEREGAGAVVDMVLRDQMWDTFGGVSQSVRIDGKLYDVVYDGMAIRQPTAEGAQSPPYLLAEGAPKGMAGFQVRTIMYVEPGKPCFTMSTQCTNLSGQTADIEILDQVSWGTIAPFLGAYGVPDHTRHVSYKTHYACGILDDFCLGVVSGHDNPIRIVELFLNRGAQSYASAKTPPNKTLQAVRTFILSKGDMAPILDYCLPLKRFASGFLEGQVTQGEEGKPVDDVQVEIRLFQKVEGDKADKPDGKKQKQPVLPLPFAITRPDAKGHYRIALPVGDYTLKTTGPGRLPMPFGGQTVFKIKEGEVTRFDNQQNPPASVVFEAVDADTGRHIPAKVRLKPLPPTARVYLGPDWQASGARDVAYLEPRPTRVPLANGRFTCVFSAGPEYDVAEKELKLEYGQSKRVKAALKKVAPAAGMLAVDLDVPTEASPDSRVSARDLVLAAAGEGVEWIVSGDLNRVTDLSEAIASRGLEKFIRASRGVRLSCQYPDLFGEFFVFPLPDDVPTKTLASLLSSNVKPQEFFDSVRRAFPDSLICVAEPSAINANYLEYYRLDPRTGRSPYGEAFSLDFDALMVAQGKAWRMNETAWDAMEQLTMSGHPKLPLASSRASSLAYAEPGYPRLYVVTGEDDPNRVSEHRLASLIREGRYFLTNGPIIEQSFDDSATTRNMTARNGEFRHALRVTAAPWLPVRSIHVSQSLMRNFRHALVTPGQKVERFPFDEKSAKPYVWPLGVAPDFKDIFFSVRVEGFGIKSVVTPIGSEVYRVFAATCPVLVDGNGDGKLEFRKR